MAAGHKTGGRVKGTPNKRTAETKAAIKAVVAEFEAAVPSAFDGDALAFMQILYRDPAQPIELRLDAAKSAAKFERPAPSAVAVQQTPKARIDLSMLSPIRSAA
jgi:hypothetical protein